MRRPARIRTNFIELQVDRSVPTAIVRTYAVEDWQGQVGWTIGRVFGAGSRWEALAVGAPAWTAKHPTRAAAVAAMRAGEDWRCATIRCAS